MFYYKTLYTDGTWDLVKSKKAIRNAKKMCVKPVYLLNLWELFNTIG